MPESKTITDVTGRKIEVRALDVLEQTDMVDNIEGNDRYLALATLVMGVRAIDGVPMIMPRNKQQIRALVQKLDEAGMAALQEHFSETAEDAGLLERAKN